MTLQLEAAQPYVQGMQLIYRFADAKLPSPPRSLRRHCHSCPPGGSWPHRVRLCSECSQCDCFGGCNLPAMGSHVAGTAHQNELRGLENLVNAVAKELRTNVRISLRRRVLPCHAPCHARSGANERLTRDNVHQKLLNYSYTEKQLHTRQSSQISGIQRQNGWRWQEPWPGNNTDARVVLFMVLDPRKKSRLVTTPLCGKPASNCKPAGLRLKVMHTTAKVALCKASLASMGLVHYRPGCLRVNEPLCQQRHKQAARLATIRLQHARIDLNERKSCTMLLRCRPCPTKTSIRQHKSLPSNATGATGALASQLSFSEDVNRETALRTCSDLDWRPCES